MFTIFYVHYACYRGSKFIRFYWLMPTRYNASEKLISEYRATCRNITVNIVRDKRDCKISILAVLI